MQARKRKTKELLLCLQSNYVRDEAAFVKENKALSDDYKQSTQTLRELQARDITIKSSARVKHAEVGETIPDCFRTCFIC